MDETKPRKMVSRNVAIALGIICIILGAIIVSFFAVANNMNGTIRTDDNQINSLNSQINNLTDICGIWDNVVLFSQNVTLQAGGTTSFPVFANYSGILSVEMEGTNESLLSQTWVRAFSRHWLYPVYGSEYGQVYPVDYDETRNYHGDFSDGQTGQMDTEYFPVLPYANAAQPYAGIIIGNNSTQTVTEYVTITYYY